jgi:hypothetical protein
MRLGIDFPSTGNRRMSKSLRNLSPLVNIRSGADTVPSSEGGCKLNVVHNVVGFDVAILGQLLRE